MSISPIREAVRQLEALGLAEHVPHHGAKVMGLDVEELRELFSIRLALETLAVRRAAELFSAEDAEAAAARLADYHEARHAGDTRAAVREHTAFHFTLYEAARSSWLAAPDPPRVGQLRALPARAAVGARRAGRTATRSSTGSCSPRAPRTTPTAPQRRCTPTSSSRRTSTPSSSRARAFSPSDPGSAQSAEPGQPRTWFPRTLTPDPRSLRNRGQASNLVSAQSAGTRFATLTFATQNGKSRTRFGKPRQTWFDNTRPASVVAEPGVKPRTWFPRSLRNQVRDLDVRSALRKVANQVRQTLPNLIRQRATLARPDRDDLVRGDVALPCHGAVRPADGELADLRRVAEAEVRARILGREVAAAGMKLLDEPPPVG